MAKYKTINDLFSELKQVAIDHNLSIDELAENTNSEPQLLRILFDESQDVIGTLSRLFEFHKIEVFSKHRIFKPYKIYDSGTQIKVTRVIEPRCSMYYDKESAKYFKFKYKFKTKKRSETTTNIIKTEIKELVEKHLKGLVLGTYSNNVKKST